MVKLSHVTDVAFSPAIQRVRLAAHKSAAMRSIVRFASGSESCSATARASSARLRQCSGSSSNAGIEILHSSKRLGTTRSWRRFGSDMLTPKEFRKNAEDCLRLSRETSQIYAKLALIVMATEFRVMAEHLERDATRRTVERLRQRVHSLLRSHRYG